MSMADRPSASQFPLNGDNLSQGWKNWWNWHYQDDATYGDAYRAGGNFIIARIKEFAVDTNNSELTELLNKLNK